METDVQLLFPSELPNLPHESSETNPGERRNS